MQLAAAAATVRSAGGFGELAAALPAAADGFAAGLALQRGLRDRLTMREAGHIGRSRSAPAGARLIDSGTSL